MENVICQIASNHFVSNFNGFSLFIGWRHGHLSAGIFAWAADPAWFRWSIHGPCRNGGTVGYWECAHGDFRRVSLSTFSLARNFCFRVELRFWVEKNDFSEIFVHPSVWNQGAFVLLDWSLICTCLKSLIEYYFNLNRLWRLIYLHTWDFQKSPQGIVENPLFLLPGT